MAIFSDRDQTEIAGHLCGDDAQAFVDIIDEVSRTLFYPGRSGQLARYLNFRALSIRY